MTGAELIAALADTEVREQVKRLLGLPDDGVADRLGALGSSQASMQAALAELAHEMKELSHEMKALAAAQAKTDASVAELARIGKETRQAVASLSDNVGFGLEELAAIVLPEVLLERRNVTVSGFERRFITTAQGEEEVDLFADAQRGPEAVFVVGEVKSRIYRGEVERFARRLERIGATLDRPLVAVMLGFVVHPSAITLAQDADILLVASRPSSAAA